MQVSYIGNTPAFQAGKVGSIPTTCSINNWYYQLFFCLYKKIKNKNTELEIIRHNN